jgi:hypothetical protein
VEKYHSGYWAIGQDGGSVLYLTNDTLGVYAVGCGDPSEPRPVHSNLDAWLSTGCPLDGEQDDDEPIVQDLWVLPGATMQQMSRVWTVPGLSVGLRDLKRLVANAPSLPGPKNREAREVNQVGEGGRRTRLSRVSCEPRLNTANNALHFTSLYAPRARADVRGMRTICSLF